MSIEERVRGLEVRFESLESNHNQLFNKIEKIQEQITKVVTETTAVKWAIISAVIVEGPEAVEAVKALFLP